MLGRVPARVLVLALTLGALIATLIHEYHPSLASLPPLSASLATFARKSQSPLARPARRLQVIKAGGVPKEGLGSSIGFLHAAVNLAVLLDADFVLSQTAAMMGYRVSDYVNAGVDAPALPLPAGARVCDIMEVLLDDPGVGAFQARMDRAQVKLDATYALAQAHCRVDRTNASAVASLEPLLGLYARTELADCDALVINDYRTISYAWSPCSMQWWRGVIGGFSGPAHGNDVAIHFRWGDMYRVAQVEAKWRFDMAKVAAAVNVIREANPAVAVRVFMKKSELGESDRRMRELLAPLDGDYTIVEAASDVEELAMLAKARYLFVNAGSYSLAAAATANAQVVVHSGPGARWYADMELAHVFDYNDYDADALREAARP